MEAKKHRNIQSGQEFNALFPKAGGTTTTVKKGATVKDTVKFIPKVVRETLYQTKGIANQLASEVEKGNVPAVAHRIWDFVYTHIRYNKDDEGYEQIRSPSRAWHDRFKGVDCDCYTTFISSILTNLGIPHVLRISKYFKDYFQHIYPVVILENGKEIIIDCVVDKFNYEEPYSEIKDTKMDLQYLEGINDADELNEIGELGKAKPAAKPKPKLIETLKKGLNVVNKLNPATALLRNGFLITMRMNMFNVPQRLKWAYLSEVDAKKKGIDLAKWKKLVQLKDKLENMHYAAGGKKEDLKKAILTGKGNKNKEVAGLLGYMPKDEVFLLDEKSPLPQLVGAEIYESEKESLQGLGELGEPITIASVTAATAAIASIAALIKGIGNIFPKNDAKGAADFTNNEQEDAKAMQAAQVAQNNTSSSAAPLPLPVAPSSALPLPAASSGAADSSQNTSDESNDKPVGFWDKNKKWLKPTLIGLGGLGLLYGGYKLIAAKKASPPALTGTDNKGKPPKISRIELM